MGGPAWVPNASQEGLADRGRNGDNNANNKARLVWSVDMHQQFVDAFNQLGQDSEWARSGTSAGRVCRGGGAR